MQQGFKDIVCAKTGAVSITKLESIQSLWSGYGEIARYRLEGVSDEGLGGANSDSVVVKHVVFFDVLTQVSDFAKLFLSI